MAFFQPKKRIFTGQIELGPQVRTWIAKHRSFASREWVESQIRYNEWIPDKSDKSRFLIYTKDTIGIKPLTILIKIRVFSTRVFVYHAHVLRKK
ncbi:MAG: hypothetical protein ABSC20_04760 [Candidatus Bathyarchaeia archaeon]|jgi:hypothetical protein